ncbi:MULTISPECIES: TnsA endonuclease N-terminal domain-containing protein [Bacillus cereus group]|uniref:TnsA endonuclease N-terminal domain-containing protein n=1 Tax=Bacillus cereus group TaxID=86661 RepID=UPI0022E5D2DE|nr:TnsA endonuclease N-terminal domain-containing protein [Bacillus cereus group sp. TH254-2LC]MDA1536570.1 DEAD/DEAH box helicase family protein [Bacillus cereus group sp. TH254-2LC]
MSKKNSFALDFAFHTHLWDFYFQNKSRIRSKYKLLSRKFLDFNDYQNPTSFLRQPQFEALEIYIFLKEYQENKKIHNIFTDWYERRNGFEKREDMGLDKNEQISWFALEVDQYKDVFARLKKYELTYANYIFALTMGTGKTILMATCIFYEFLLANKLPNDKRFCHNAIIFAPDKTVLQSLREIQTFDKSKVIPPEYLAWLDSNLKFHFLEDTGTTLNTIDRSKYNIIISNTQKIILKRQHKEKSKVETLFDYSSTTGSAYDQLGDLYSFEEPSEAGELLSNQRFSKLTRLGNLGVFIDEAHHAFGDTLAKDMGLKTAKTSLRLTINELASSLEKSGTSVIGCYNFTGTPYSGKEVFPEVVYSYGLQEAINKGYLKKVHIEGYTNPKSKEFLRIAVKDFWEKYNTQRYEGMLPKLAIFASTVEELQNELRPELEDILNDLGIPIDKILVNVGNDKITSNDDIREFNKLDSPESNKQFILLVNKGREGWNCRSLFGVALYRKPKSKVFVLQATMRCLRAIGPVQETGQVYLSEENLEILDDELNKNFRLNIEDLNKMETNKEKYKIRLVPPPVKITLNRTQKLHSLRDKNITGKIDFELDKIDLTKYQLKRISQDGLKGNRKISEDLKGERDKRQFSQYTLVAEISKYLNKSCIEIEKLLLNSLPGIEQLVEIVSDYNEVLYDHIIPKLFEYLYELKPYESKEEYEIDLVKESKEGYYQVTAKPDLVAEVSQGEYTAFKEKSFHLDTYCFDSKPEKKFFEDVVHMQDIKKIYFTGMLTHGQTDFYIQYIDPDSNNVRKYYPDFLVEKTNGDYVIVEVKGDNKIEDPVVLAKERAARETATASRMEYKIIKGSEVMNEESSNIF